VDRISCGNLTIRGPVRGGWGVVAMICGVGLFVDRIPDTGSPALCATAGRVAVLD